MVDVEIEVDMRSYWSGVRDQGPRPACLACTTSDAHMHSHKRTQALSAEFLFYHSAQRMPNRDARAGLTFVAADDALRTAGQPDENDWPYQRTQPDPWQPPVIKTCWYGELKDATTNNADQIAAVLRSSTPVVLGIELTAAFFDPQAPYIIPAGGNGFGGHAVLAIGLGRTTDGCRLILIRNSWGVRWAMRGHAWLAEDYLAHKLIGARTLTALDTG